MRICSTSTLSVAFLLALFGTATAQTRTVDSSRYDLGTLSLNREFTQHVTIRGEDLEKMPFVNLSDAIRAWLFGAFAQPVLLTYVVDGNPVSNVDVYPIFEIEEITFIDDAAATAAYGNTQKELVLITTRRASGIRAAVQTGLVKADINGTGTHTRLYQHYYLGAYKNLNKVSFGVSADWQRDVMPEGDAAVVHVYSPNHLERWRLNGYLAWRPDAHNTIEVRAGYAPERVGEDVDSLGTPFAYRVFQNRHEHLLVPSVSWQGNWGRGLRNKFFAEYLHSSADMYETDSLAEFDNGNEQLIRMREITGAMSDHLFLRDHLSYEAVAGSWHIVPELDLSYQHIKERSGYRSETEDAYSFGGGQAVLPSEPPLEKPDEDIVQKGSLFYITPSVDLTLAKALDVQAGLFVNASAKTDKGNRRFFPFLSAAVDVLHLQSVSTGASLKVFGSYARRPMMFLNDYGLYDHTGGGRNQTLFNLYHLSNGYETIGGQPATMVSSDVRVEPGYSTWVAGAAFTTADGRFALQYSYEQRSFSFSMIDMEGYWGYESWREHFHHVDLRVKVLDCWTMGLNASLLRSKTDTTGYAQNIAGFPNTPFGDVSPAAYSWTGGWVNRIRFGSVTAGVDLLYHFGVAASEGLPHNTVALPNVFVGYRFSLPGARAMDVFIESRGLVMNTPSDVLDQRRYYTLGASFGF